MKLSAIILSRTISKDLFEMTSKCINTLISSEKNIETEVIVVESNKKYFESGFKYPEFVKVIVPEADFNFHKFLNIGISASSGDYIASCNNDLIFYEDWFSEILKVAEKNPKIRSFSPNGKNVANFQQDFEIGYKVRTHVFGWCFITKRDVFDQTGLLDETFDFNFADNDYALTLKKYNVQHAVVFRSNVEHLDPKEANIDKGDWYSLQQKAAAEKLKADPKYNSSTDKKALEDSLKFHKKWGNANKLYRKNKIADVLIRYHLGFLNKIILSL